MLLTVAGFQVPVILLLEIVGKIGAVAPAHIVGIALNIGVKVALTFTVTATLSVLSTP